MNGPNDFYFSGQTQRQAGCSARGQGVSQTLENLIYAASQSLKVLRDVL